MCMKQNEGDTTNYYNVTQCEMSLLDAASTSDDRDALIPA